jgi:hypothetical protein
MALTGLLEKYLLVTLYNTGDMAVTIEMQNTGDSRARREILAGVEHVLSDLAGEWRVSMVGSRANDDWERKGEGPYGFERSYALVGEAGEHQPEAIRNHTGSRCLPVEGNIAGSSCVRTSRWWNQR